MATIAITQPRYLGNAFGHAAITKGGPEQPNLKEAASQTFDAGAPLNFSSGLLQIVADSADITTLAGFALKDASGTTNEPVRYRPVRAGDRYVMNYISTTAQAHVGTIKTLDQVSGVLQVGDATTQDGTKVFVKIIDLYSVAAGYPDGDVVGDTYGRYVVEFPDQPGLVG